jgi:hypothetical protein
MKAVNKDVSIGEGSAAASPFNVQGMTVFRTAKPGLLDGMQQSVFDKARLYRIGQVPTCSAPGRIRFR